MSDSGGVVVITGASGGIGAALARRLGRDGKRLVLAARRESELRSVASDAEAAGAKNALTVPTDVTRREAVNHLRDAAHPVAEMYTNPASSQLVRDYYNDVAGFEDRLAQARR